MEEKLRCILVVTAGATSGLSGAGSLSGVALQVVECPSDRAQHAAQEFAPQCVILDVSIAEEVCRTLIHSIRVATDYRPIVVAVPAGSVSHAVAAMRAGADWVVEKPIHTAAVSQLKQWLEGSARQRAAQPSTGADFGRLVGVSDLMRGVYSQLSAVAPRDTTVLLTGESGTGKELVAREIHDRSSRFSGPFVAINCGAIPESLIESELFGHERGSFTSASERRIGSVELANGGTLFLDEVSELSQRAQVKLLRFLQERQVQRVGNSRPITVDTRVVAASSRDLDELVRRGLFRHDLLYRINVVHLSIPALRDRKQDIDVLFQSCMQKLSPRYGGRELRLSVDAREALNRYSWPGNVRELENVVEYLLALHESDEVHAYTLPQKLQASIGTRRGCIKVEPETSGTRAFGEANRLLETELIVDALERSQYVQSKAARLLGISRRILKYKMDKLGIVNERCSFTASQVEHQ